MQCGRNLVAAALLLLASSGALAKQPFVRPLVPLYDAAGLTRACEDALASARKTAGDMEAKRGAGAIFAEWNRLEIAVEDVVYPMWLLGQAHPDGAVRDAAERCQQEDAALSAARLQSEKLFARVKAAQPANARQAKLKKDLIEAFEDNGVALPPDGRSRVKQIRVKLEQLRQAFERNLREDATKVTFVAAEMAGLPDAYLKAHEPWRDADGNYALSLNASSYLPFMQNASNESARKRYYIARWNQGGAANIGLLDEIFGLRKELAQLFGFPSYAHYALRRRMVERPETVFKFLADVKAAVTEVERNEIEELRVEKAKDQGTPLAETRLARWDVDFYQERVRRSRYAIDQQKLREYFPTDKSVEFVFAVAQRLYGVRFNETKVATWHPDVRYFDVVDAKSNRFLGGVYLDLFPRAGKIGESETPIRNASRVAGRTPLTALVLTLDRHGLDHRQLQVPHARIRPRPAQCVLEDRLCAPQQRKARLRRSARADVRGVGAARAAAGAVQGDMPAMPATHVRGHQEPGSCAALRQGSRVRARVAASNVRHDAIDRPATGAGAVEAPRIRYAARPCRRHEFPVGVQHTRLRRICRRLLRLHVVAGDRAGPADAVQEEHARPESRHALSQCDPRARRAAGRNAAGAQFLGRDPSSEAFFAEITGRR
jgi:hypothetical protein